MDRIFSRVISLFYLYTPWFAISLVYMLQVTEYRPYEFIAWLQRNPDFRRVQRRKTLIWTVKATLLVLIAWTTMVMFVAAGLAVLVKDLPLLALVIFLTYPLAQVAVLIISLVTGYVLVQRGREKKIVSSAEKVFVQHPGVKIAIAGSYGKTTMKEILKAVLGETLHVAATHGNMNTPLGISRLARKLDGSEDVLIFEYGEEHPGDVKKLAELTHPSIGVMTGISMAHLSSFKSIDAVADTIFELVSAPKIDYVYKNINDPEIKKRVTSLSEYDYSSDGVGDWKIAMTPKGFEGMDIVASNGKKKITARTALVGEHLVGPLAAAIAIADSLGMTCEQIQQGIMQTKPFKHRMQPYQLAGATVIDDTYNGNPEGVKAGLKLLKTADARRRIYVTPGLVEQGDQVAKVHTEIGELAAESADIVVLMKNSVTKYIKTGLDQAGFKGELKIVDDPIAFYTRLDMFVASGDVVLMQNDWTDNYF